MTLALYRSIEACRICGDRSLVELMAFGEQYLASTFVKSNQGHPMATVKVPLTVVMCGACKTVQLKEDVDRDALFTDYFYRSGTNPMMRAALEDVVREVQAKVALAPGDAVLDIGCNDATMLLSYPSDLARFGVDPASNLDWSRAAGQATLINDYFSKDAFLAASGGRRPRAITTIAMLYNIAELDRVVGEIAAVLAVDGVWCIQLSYLPSLLDTLSFYDVCHEHLYYFSLETLERLLARHGLTVFDASTNGVNGGSLRAFASRDPRAPKSEAYLAIQAAERARLLDDPALYRRFFERVLEMRGAIVRLLRNERAAGRTVVGLGASTKGNVLLQFFGIDNALLPAISERNPDKCGLRTLGTDIAVISEEEARAMKPSLMLVLIWFFKEELLRRERAYLEAGGRLLFPMPHPHLVGAEGETRL